jgi:hypothetical protein
MKASVLRTVDLAQRCLLRLFLRLLKPKAKPKEATPDNLSCVWNVSAGDEYIPCANPRGLSTDANASEVTDKQAEGGLSSSSSSLQTHLGTAMTELDTRHHDGEHVDYGSRRADGAPKKSLLTKWMEEFEEQRAMKLEARNAHGKLAVELAPRKSTLSAWLEAFEVKHQNQS